MTDFGVQCSLIEAPALTKLRPRSKQLAPPASNLNAILAAVAMELCVYDTPMDRPIPPLAIAIQAMMSAFCMVVCNFDSDEIEVLTLPEFRSVGRRHIEKPMCVASGLDSGRSVLAVASNKGQVHFWDRKTDRSIGLDGNAAGNLQTILQLGGDRLLLTSYVKDKIFIYDTVSGKVLASCDCKGGKPWGAYLREDGMAIIGTVDGVILYDPDANAIQNTKNFGRTANKSYGVFGVHALADDRLVCADYYEKCIWFWDKTFDHNVPLSRLNLSFSPHDVLELPDGTLAVSSHLEKKIYIFATPEYGFESPMNKPIILKTIVKGTGEDGPKIAGPTGLAIAAMGLAVDASNSEK